MQQTIHGDCTELTAFVCEHLSVCLRNPFPQEAVCCIHHPQRKHEQDQLFLGPLLYLFSEKVVQVSPFFASILLQIEWNILKLKVFRTILSWPRIRNQSQYLQFFYIWSGEQFLLHSSIQFVKLLNLILGISVMCWRLFFNFYIWNIICNRYGLLVHI